ncbi:ABC transporter substrate-binding protein [Sphingomonas psychrotolerans]|uniref:ABC transporter substrate-binding protein n=1 Tax=Sphingomonas psychrotolerans TaxID=1327635 RepID=A0ABU3N7H3_9SPHN|nr:ABC transporter substrate-binding protein [Sphingomonas psychrotolerans]
MGRGLAIAAAALLVAGCARPVARLTVYGSTATLEIAPVLVAARQHRARRVMVTNGGIANLVGAARGRADLATHAETQVLRYSVEHPDIRILLTLTEGQYRIVARRSAGIRALADLKGKRVATLATTSAGYFLARMLEQAGLGFDDIFAVRVSPVEDMAGALVHGEVDAVAIWEPHADAAARALGDDRVEFTGDGVYRELFSLNTTAAALATPARRHAIVRFVREIIHASATIRRNPREAQALAAREAGFTPQVVARAWPSFRFPAALPADLLDVLVEEERWLAEQQGRAPRSRAVLASLIDTSVLAEAQEQ